MTLNVTCLTATFPNTTDDVCLCRQRVEIRLSVAAVLRYVRRASDEVRREYRTRRDRH